MSAFKSWRTPNDEQIAAGQAELAAIIGPVEAARPSWQRRLVLAEPGGEWCLLVDEAAQPSLPKLAPWAEPEVQLRAFPTAYPLAEACALLSGPRNPEEVLRQRRARVAAHEAEIAAEKVKRAADEAARTEAGQRIARQEAALAATEWWRTQDLVAFALALANRVQERDYKLARDLRQMAEPGRRLSNGG